MKKIWVFIALFFVAGSLQAQWDSVGFVPLNTVLTSPSVGYYYDHYYEEGKTSSNPKSIGYLYKSVDMWKTWSLIRTIGSWLDPGSITDVQFNNDSNGYMCSYVCGMGGLAQTADGGATWKSIAGGEPDISYSFLRTDYGYCQAWGPYGYGFYLYDHGNYSVQDSTGPGIRWLKSILFINDSTGFLIKYLPKPSLYRTEDYGKSWTKLYISDSSWTLPRLSFPDKFHGFFLNDSNYLFFSDDMGKTWNPVGQIPLQTVNDIFFLTPTTGWVAGPAGKILKTASGGMSWQVVPSGVSSNIVRIKFFSDTIGYFLTRIGPSWSDTYVLYRTHEGPWAIPETTKTKPVRILQNPVRSTLILSVNDPQAMISSLEIIDMKGKIVYHSDVVTEEINVSSFPSGLYFLRYTYNGVTYAEKVVKMADF